MNEKTNNAISQIKQLTDSKQVMSSTVQPLIKNIFKRQMNSMLQRPHGHQVAGEQIKDKKYL